MGESTRARLLLEERRRGLLDLEKNLEDGRDLLTGRFQTEVEEMSGRVASMRARRLLELAEAEARRLEEVEALTLYTAADIEISRMETTVRALQEAVQ